MLYVVYLDEKEYPPTLMGAFLMKKDAQGFLDHHNLKDKLALAEVDGVWQHWQDIKDKTKEFAL